MMTTTPLNGLLQEGLVTTVAGQIVFEPRSGTDAQGRALLDFLVRVMDAYAAGGALLVRVFCHGELAEKVQGEVRQYALVEVTGLLRPAVWSRQPGTAELKLSLNARSVRVLLAGTSESALPPPAPVDAAPDLDSVPF